MGTDTASGIGNLQGNISPTGGNRYTADNQFSHTSGAKDFWIENAPYAFGSTYSYYSAPGNCGVATAWLPSTINHLALTCYSSASAPDCSTGGNGHRTMYSNPITQAVSDARMYENLCDSMTNLIDGGNTNALLNLINGNNNPAAVYNSLSNAAPYLSNAVLTAYLNSQYPAGNITALLNACSPLNSSVYKAVQASALSSGIKSQIGVLQNGLPKLDSLKMGIEGAFSSSQLSYNMAIRNLLNTNASDSIAMGKALMKEQALYLPLRSQIECGLKIQDSVMAAEALTQLMQLEGQSNYVKLSTILLSHLSKSPEELMQNQSVVGSILPMIQDSSDRLTYVKAHTLLGRVGLSKYVPYVQENNPSDNSSENNRSTMVQQTTSAPASESTLFNSPNPFKESTLVNANVVEKTQNAYILVTDIVGNIIAKYPVQQGENNITIQANTFSNAIMFCTLVVDGVRIKMNKMVLLK